MPRRVKQKIELNKLDSLGGLAQEIYNDACLQIKDAQGGIDVLTTSTLPTDVIDHTNIAKEKANFLKVKDSAIKIKLEVAKLQRDIIQNNGDTDKVITEKTGGATADDFSEIREMLKNGGMNKNLIED
jgi:hypothetical protein